MGKTKGNTTQRRGAGGPLEHDGRISFRIKKTRKAKLRAIARREGLEFSDYMRQLCENAAA